MYRPRLLYLLLLPALLAQASLALGGSATDPKPLPDMRIRQVLARHVHKGEPIPDIGVPAPWPTYNLVFVIDNLGPGVLHQSGTEFELMVECQDLTAGKPCTSPAIPPRYYLTVYRDVPPNDPAGLCFQTDWQGNEGAGDDWNHQLRVKAAINPQKQIKKSDAAQVCEAFETIFGLLRHIDEGRDDIIFFADEGGSWQVGADWRRVLPAWFTCLAATAQPEEYARRVVETVYGFDGRNGKKHLAAARRIATPAQRKALQAACRHAAAEESRPGRVPRKPR